MAMSFWMISPSSLESALCSVGEFAFNFHGLFASTMMLMMRDDIDN